MYDLLGFERLKFVKIAFFIWPLKTTYVQWYWKSKQILELYIRSSFEMLLKGKSRFWILSRFLVNSLQYLSRSKNRKYDINKKIKIVTCLRIKNSILAKDSEIEDSMWENFIFGFLSLLPTSETLSILERIIHWIYL